MLHTSPEMGEEVGEEVGSNNTDVALDMGIKDQFGRQGGLVLSASSDPFPARGRGRVGDGHCRGASVLV